MHRTHLTRRRRAVAIGLAAAALLTAGACSKTEDTVTGGATATTGKGGTTGTGATGSSVKTGDAKDLSKMLEGVTLVSTGKLTVCSDIPYAPFEFYAEDDKDKLTGFDVELVEAMAESLGVTADFKTTPFDGIIPALAADSCDIIASATTINDERKEKVDFTEPYFDADQSLLIQKKDEGTYKKLDDLKGKTIGVQDGTTGADYAEEHKPEGATIKSFGGADDMFAAIASGDVDALLQDFPVNKYRAVKDSSKFTVTETFKTDEKYGIAVKKENKKLTEALDAALADARSNGTYDKIYTTWFGAKA